MNRCTSTSLFIASLTDRFHWMIPGFKKSQRGDLLPFSAQNKGPCGNGTFSRACRACLRLFVSRVPFRPLWRSRLSHTGIVALPWKYTRCLWTPPLDLRFFYSIIPYTDTPVYSHRPCQIGYGRFVSTKSWCFSGSMYVNVHLPEGTNWPFCMSVFLCSCPMCPPPQSSSFIRRVGSPLRAISNVTNYSLVGKLWGT